MMSGSVQDMKEDASLNFTQRRFKALKIAGSKFCANAYIDRSHYAYWA